MGTAAAEPTLDEIITENAHLLLKRRIVARRIERRPYYLNTLAAEMVPFMVSEAAIRADGFDMSAAIDRIAQSMKRYLGFSTSHKLAWRVDYLEAFARTLGVQLGELLDSKSAPSEDDQAMFERMLDGAEWQLGSPKRVDRDGLPPRCPPR